MIRDAMDVLDFLYRLVALLVLCAAWYEARKGRVVTEKHEKECKKLPQKIVDAIESSTRNGGSHI